MFVYLGSNSLYSALVVIIVVVVKAFAEATIFTNSLKAGIVIASYESSTLVTMLLNCV